MTMIPGEYFTDGAAIELNAGRSTAVVEVNNTGDRPIQVGSHCHVFEVNRALDFDRAAAYGMRLDIAAGTAVRFEAGDTREVDLVAIAGHREVHGINGVVHDITSKHTGTIEWAFRGPPLLDRKILGRRVEAGVNSLGSAPRESTIDRRLRTTR